MSFTLGALRSLRHKDTPIKGAPQNWPHQAEQLKTGHMSYTCKLLGYCEVDQPKGFETVENAMEKIKFRRDEMKKQGNKPKKVEIRINIHTIKLLDAKSKTIIYQFPLHQVSYCADNKHDHRTLAFIALEDDGYLCFAFDSKKKDAKEIALTIGQAFDLSYQHHLKVEGGIASGDLKEQIAHLQALLAQAEQDKRHLQEEIDQLRQEREEYEAASSLQKLSSLVDVSEPSMARRISAVDDSVVMGIRGRRNSRDIAASLGYPVITGLPRQSRITQTIAEEDSRMRVPGQLGLSPLLHGFHTGLSLSTHSLNVDDDEAES